MSSINFVKKTSGDNVVTDGGEVFYPVTTVNAVYYNQTKTLREILDGEYDESSDIKNNGIYAWLDNLSKRFNDYVSKSEFNTTNKTIDTISKSVSDCDKKMDDLSKSVDSLSSNINLKITSLENNMYVPEFDKAPTKGSDKLITSGSVFSYLNKVIKNDIFDFKTVTNLDEYTSAENGEVVINIGESDDKYMFGGMYQCEIKYGEAVDICSEPKKTISWKLLGNVLNEGQTEVDLSKFYNKTEIDTMLATKVKTYTAGNNISIVDGKISATVPDVSSFATKKELNEGLQNAKPVEYTAGNGISIKNNVISLDIDNSIDLDSNKPVTGSAVVDKVNLMINESQKKYTYSTTITIPQGTVTSKIYTKEIEIPVWYTKNRRIVTVCVRTKYLASSLLNGADIYLSVITSKGNETVTSITNEYHQGIEDIFSLNNDRSIFLDRSYQVKSVSLVIDNEKSTDLTEDRPGGRTMFIAIDNRKGSADLFDRNETYIDIDIVEI